MKRSTDAAAANLAANLAALEARGMRPVVQPPEGDGAWFDGDPAFVRRPDGQRIRLHSGRDPVGEAARWLGSLQRGPDGLLVVIGLGLGFLLDALEARSPAVRVLALEPAPATVGPLLERRDWRSWIDKGRLFLLAGPDYAGAPAVAARLGAGFQDPPLLVHPVLARTSPAAVARARTVVEQILFDARANDEARREQAGLYLRNTLANLPVLERVADVSRLRGSCGGVPAVVVAAGPSLDRNVAEVAAMQDAAAVIAVDTALRPLLDAGVEPHLVVGVDPTPVNARHLTDLPRNVRTHLVAEPSLDPRAFAAFGGRVFCFRVGTHHPWPWLVDLGVQCGTLRAWGSVVTCATDLALEMGCDPIIFAGLDLAYTHGRLYGRGVTFELDWASERARGATSAAILQAAIANRETMTLEDLRGERTLTARHLLAFRDWIVEQSLLRADRQFINITGAGMLMGGRIAQEAASGIRLPDGDGTRVRERLEALTRPEGPPMDLNGAARTLANRIRRRPAADEEPIRSWLESAPSLTLNDIARAIEVNGAGGTSGSAYDAAFHRAAADLYATLRRDVLQGGAPPAGKPEEPPLSPTDLRTVATLLREAEPPAIAIDAEGDESWRSWLLELVPPGTRILPASEPVQAAGAAEPAAGRDPRESRSFTLLVLRDGDAAGPQIRAAANAAAPGSAIVLLDARSGTRGLSLHPEILKVLDDFPDVDVAERRTDDWWTSVTILRRGVVNGPLLPHDFPPSARLVRRLCADPGTSPLLVVGHRPADWLDAPGGGLGGRAVAVTVDECLQGAALEGRFERCLIVSSLEALGGAGSLDALLAQLAGLCTSVAALSPPAGRVANGTMYRWPLARLAGAFRRYGFALTDELWSAAQNVPPLEADYQEIWAQLWTRRVGSDAASELDERDRWIERLMLENRLLRLEQATLDADLSQAAPDAPVRLVELNLPADRIEHEAGHSYTYRFQTAVGQLLTTTPRFLRLELLEDGRPLPRPRSYHQDIIERGEGRTSFWPPVVYFATSDNTNPRRNGRRYSIRVPAALFLLERLPGCAVQQLGL